VTIGLGYLSKLILLALSAHEDDDDRCADADRAEHKDRDRKDVATKVTRANSHTLHTI
jgi:hypothetical protein